MIKQKIKKVFSLILITYMFTLSLAHAIEPIKINTYTSYPPYLYHDNEQQTGLYIRIVELTLQAISQPYTIHSQPLKRGIHNTQSGDGVMIGIIKNEERMSTLDFSLPFYQEKVSVYFNRKQTPLLESVNELNDLTIGTLFGWSYGEHFDNAKRNNKFFTSNSDIETNFSLLAKGRLDAVIHSELSAFHVLHKMELNNKVFLASKPLALTAIHFAVKKGTHQQLLNRINQKLTEPAHRVKINAIISEYQNEFIDKK